MCVGVIFLYGWIKFPQGDDSCVINLSFQALGDSTSAVIRIILIH